MQNTIDFIQVLIHAIIALFAGFMRELNSIHTKGKFSLMRLISSGAVSSFVGVTVFFLLQNFEVSPYMTAFCTSIAGWMGGNLMDYFASLLKRYFSKKITNLTDNDDK